MNTRSPGRPDRAAADTAIERRIAALALAWLASAFSLAYWLSNRLTAARADIGDGVFEWERAIPFVAWTIVPYLSIGVFFIASFFVARHDRTAFERHVACLALTLAVSLACYAAYPLRFTFDRPATDGVFGLLFDALTAVDRPYNRAPSLHISVLIVLWARFTPHLGGWRRLALHGWFALIALSVLTTYQHHVIDVPAGLLAGGLCLALTSRPRRSAAPTPIVRAGIHRVRSAFTRSRCAGHPPCSR